MDLADLGVDSMDLGADFGGFCGFGDGSVSGFSGFGDGFGGLGSGKALSGTVSPPMGYNSLRTHLIITHL